MGHVGGHSTSEAALMWLDPFMFVLQGRLDANVSTARMQSQPDEWNTFSLLHGAIPEQAAVLSAAMQS
jgi:hypothetical protein